MDERASLEIYSYIFFSQTCLSTYFIKKKAVKDNSGCGQTEFDQHKITNDLKKLKKHRQTAKDHNKQPAAEVRPGRTPPTLQPKPRPT